MLVMNIHEFYLQGCILKIGLLSNFEFRLDKAVTMAMGNEFRGDDQQ